MLGRFRVYLDNFFDQRVEDITILAQRNDSFIAELKQEQRAQEKILIEKLDEEGRKAFVEYESASTCAYGKIQDKLYRQGFFDGIKAARMFR